MKSKRRFLQIHLLSAIVLMIAAGVLLQLNMFECKPVPSNPFELTRPQACYGWPFVCYRPKHPVGFQRFVGPDGIALDLPQTGSLSWAMNRTNRGFFPAYVALNVTTCASLLLAVAVFCERLIRRRARRGPETAPARGTR